jgi:ribosomal protein S18 acetylase RimI-like enzyme
MGVTIRGIECGDLTEVLRLMRDFARYGNLEQYLEVTKEQMYEAMFGENAFVNSLIAFDNDSAVGYAIFYPNFLTFRGERGYFLEDLYVSESARGKGVGQKMLARIAKMAAERGFERIDFLVLDWNQTAIDFYEKLGAVRAKGESHFKFTDAAFNDLADGSADSSDGVS